MYYYELPLSLRAADTKFLTIKLGLGEFKTVTKSNKFSGAFRAVYDHLRLESREIEARYFPG